MVSTPEKIRENYYRRMAKRLHLELMKSKARKWSIDNHQGFMIVDPYLNTIEAGQKFDMSLDEAAKYLEDYEQELKAKQ